MKFKPGDKLHKYEIVRLLGQGGMGEVWFARDSWLERDVALKCLNPQLTQDGEFDERFLREARIQGRLSHANIVTLHDFFEAEGQYYMVLEYAPGITLRQLIDRTGPIPERRALGIFGQIAAALGYAHSKDIIHRDVKPSNIMVDPDNQDHVLMMDFGIARLMTEGHLTRTGTRLGTMHYMSPEQVLAKKDIDARSDVYSAGVVLYEMLSGRLPFNADTDSDYLIQDKIVKEEIPDPREVYPYISDGTVNLLRSFTVKDRDQRPSGFGANAAQPVTLEAVSSEAKTQLSPAANIVVHKRSERIEDNLVLVEGGSFMMGSDDGSKDEKPVHQVTLDSFRMGMFAVTQKEWREVKGSNPLRGKGNDLPVVGVTWYEAVKFCNQLSLKEGLTPCYEIVVQGIFRTIKVNCDWDASGYRLPTEAEWEYAARGGKLSRGCSYAGSNDLDSVGWFCDNSGGKQHGVGLKNPNELGIHDLSGNILEWCWDWYDERYYSNSPQQAPKGPAKGLCRILRGGSVYEQELGCRVTSRYY